MTGLGRNIFEHDFGHIVYAVATNEKSSQRVSVQMYVVFNNGNVSDITTITQALLQMSEKISSISMSVSILSECRGYMAQILIEMKEMNKQLKKLNNEDSN